MMREKIRTVGISAMLEHPAAVTYAAHQEAKEVDAPPNVLRAKDGSEDDWATDGSLKGEDIRDPRKTISVGAKRRGASYNYDLGIESISAVSEDGLAGRN